MIKKVIYIFSILLMLFGFFGFLVFTFLYPQGKEVPLNNIKGFVINSCGDVFVGIGGKSRVQVYNKDGVFIRNWHIPSMGKGFSISINEEENICITNVSDLQVIYTNTGRIISETKKKYISKKKNTFKTKGGEKYEVKGEIFPEIVRVFPDNKVVVKQNHLLQLLRFLSFWLLLAIGMLLLFTLKRKTFFSTRSRKYATFPKKTNKRTSFLLKLKFREKFIIYSFIIALLISLIYEVGHYKKSKYLIKVGQTADVSSIYNPKNNYNYYYFKTTGNKKIFLYKKQEAVGRLKHNTKVIYNPSNPSSNIFSLYKFSFKHFISHANTLGILLMFIFALIARFEKLNYENYKNWDKYKIKKNYNKYRYYRWIFKQHPFFNVFVFNTLIIVNYVLSFLYFKAPGTPQFFIYIVFISFFIFIAIFNKYVVLNDKKIIVYFWFIPWKQQIINIDNIKEIFGEQTKNGWRTYLLKKDGKKVFFNFMFNKKMKNDLLHLVEELISYH